MLMQDMKVNVGWMEEDEKQRFIKEEFPSRRLPSTPFSGKHVWKEGRSCVGV